MFIDMKKQPTETWTAKDSEDASRLLAGLVRRAKKTSGETPDQLQIDRTCPSSPVEKAAGRLEGLQRPAAAIATNSGRSGGSEAMNDNLDGRVLRLGAVPPTDADRPPSRTDDSISSTDRALTLYAGK